MKNFAYIILLFVLFSCGAKIEPSYENSLNGKWNWVSSTGGFIGKKITPESENKTLTLEISDSVIKKYENGNLLSKKTYSIQTQNSIYGNDRKMIVIEDMPSQSFEVKGNTLYLNDECHDCYQSEYVRVK
jgi:hypothetical protein